MTAVFEFRLPDIGEGVTEGEIVEWLVQPGDVVREDDPMVEIMTDKATVAIGAPVQGTIAELRFAVGERANVGDVILTIETAQERPMRSSGPPATAVGDIQSVLPGARFFEGHQPANGHRNGNGNGSRRSSVRPAIAAQKRSVQTSGLATTTSIDYFEAKPLATPATRRLAKEMDVDLRRVRPSGPGGRVTREDVQTAMDVASPAPVASTNEEERKPFVGMRRAIADRLHRSTSTAAHFTFVEECDASRLIEVRDMLRPEAERQGVKLTYLPFIVQAVTAALKNHPLLNSSLDEERQELVYKKHYNIGVATATEAGLMVPVIKHADRLRLVELAREIDRLSEAARAGTLKPEELRHSTFTVTSLGKHGGLFATPILNYPEVGILGVHQIKERPVVRQGNIVVGHVMLLSLSFDHRVVDGHIGAAFAYEVIESLENPERLLGI